MNCKRELKKVKPKSQLKEASPIPCIHPLLYPSKPDVTHVICMTLHDAPMMSHITTYVAMSPYDAQMTSCSFWWKTHLRTSMHCCVRATVPHLEYIY